MFWWILLGVSAVLTILGTIFWIKEHKECNEVEEFLSAIACVIGIFVMLIMLIVNVAVRAENNKLIATFEQQKYYIENVVPTLPESDNYAITMKKIELNEWLYNAQYDKTHYSFFSFYPDRILELEEIK